MNLSVAKIVGSLSDTSWSQVHTFVPDDAAKLESHGELLAAISFKAKAEIEISSFGSEIVKRLQEIYYSNEAGSLLKKLSQTIETLAAEFLDQVELEIVALVFWKDFLYAARNDGGQVWILRDEALVRLFNVNPGGIATISGKLVVGDALVAATGQFSQLVPEGSLRAELGQETAAAAAESLTAQVHGHANNSRAAAVVAKSEKMAEPKAEVKPKRKMEIFIGPHGNKTRRLSLTVGLVLLLVFGLSLVLSGMKRQNEERQQTYQAIVDEVNYKFDEANNLLTLNPLRAKSLLLESQTRIKEYKEKGNKLSQEILDLEQKVAAALEQTQREYAVTAAEWYDFDLVKDGFRGQAWDLSETELLVWDGASKTAVLLTLENKAAEIIISGESLGEVRSVGLTEGRGFAVAPDKVTVINTLKQEQVAQVAADGWKNITAVKGFGSNLYLLDSAADSQIWKYLGLDEGLSGKRSYLVGETFDLSEAVDMAIDGSVWVLFSDGTIAKYTQGKKDAFQVIGLDQPFGEAVKIFTSPEVEHLYVVDRSNTRVVVLDKSGEYAAQYQWSGIAGAKDLVVSEALGKMFFLTGEKVFTIDLK